MTEEQIVDQLAEAEKSQDPTAAMQVMSFSYMYSQAIRGDNTPEYARYLNFLIGQELYPDLKLCTLESFFQEVLDGKVDRVYKSRFE